MIDDEEEKRRIENEKSSLKRFDREGSGMLNSKSYFSHFAQHLLEQHRDRSTHGVI